MFIAIVCPNVWFNAIYGDRYQLLVKMLNFPQMVYRAFSMIIAEILFLDSDVELLGILNDV